MDSYTKNIFHKLFRAIFEECYAVLCGCGSGINGSNVFTVVDKMIMAKEKDTGCSYARKKPVELYEELIHNFSKDKTLEHILDCYSGAGSCALACMSLKL